MDLNKLTDKAKQIIEERGGVDALKDDATELKDIATGEGSLTDKAKAALAAVKDPGARGGDDTPPADTPPADTPTPPAR